MGTLRVIDTLLEELLQEDDLVTNKASGASYIVKKFNPIKHELIKPKISDREAQDFESGKKQTRAAQGKKELQSLRKTDPQSIKAVNQVPVSKDIGPETPDQAIGSNPKAEKQLATRMAQLGQVSAKYLTAIKTAVRELKDKNPNMSDEELEKAAKAEVKKRGVPPPPSYDLCTVSIPGTNLFCGGNKEIPRDEMPQLKTKAVPGTPAWKKAEEIAKEKGIKPEDVEVNAEKAFLQYLSKKGVNITQGQSMPATQMKATQNQLNADKVAGMAWALYSNPETKDPKHPLRQPLIVSNDGYVLDGHHRWAALATYDVMRGEKEPTDVPVIKVDMDIEDLVDMSNKFGDKFGLARKGMGASAEGSKDKGAKASTSAENPQSPKATKSQTKDPKAQKMSKTPKKSVQSPGKETTDASAKKTNPKKEQVKKTLMDKIGKVMRNIKNSAGEELEVAKKFTPSDWLQILFGATGGSSSKANDSDSSSSSSNFGGGRSGGGGATGSW